jgi:hypothetical protein
LWQSERATASRFSLFLLGATTTGSFSKVIPSTQGQTLQEVLAEMSRLLPTAGAESKNPTTNRRNTNNQCLLLPSDLKISEIEQDLGLRLCERYLLILSHIYLRGLLWKKEEEGLGNYIAIKRDELRRLGGEKYASLLAYGLKKGHLVKGRPYRIGRWFNEYMLNQRTLSLRHQVACPLNTKRARQIHSLQMSVGMRRFAKRHPVYRKIAEGSLLKRPFPLMTIHDAIVTTKDGVREVEDALKKSFGTIGLSPKLTTKKLGG